MCKGEAMPGKNLGRRGENAAGLERRRPGVRVVVAVGLSLFGAWTVVSSGVFDSAFGKTSQSKHSHTTSPIRTALLASLSSSNTFSSGMVYGPQSVANNQPDTFPACMVDDAHSDKAVLFNAATGDYRFCCGGVVVASGRGTVSVINDTVSIHHIKGNRTVDISTTQSGSGTASIQRNGHPPTCQITDTAMLGDVFTCPSQPSFAAARVDPINRTGQPGEDLFSGNYNWSLPILGLGGRAGLDLGLSLTCNSLVWTGDGSSIGFDADKGFPAAGFRLGFPTIQQQAYVSQSDFSALLMILP